MTNLRTAAERYALAMGLLPDGPDHEDQSVPFRWHRPRSKPGCPGCDLLIALESVPPDLATDLVRELAAMGPVGEDTYYGCHFCRAGNLGEKLPTQPADHEPSCLWRRAKELVG